jgi:membrane fusion protein (multidrug efflux system)
MTDTNKQASNAPVAPPAAASPAANPQGRRKGLTIVAAAVAVAAVAWGGWHWMVARNYQTTDNAYVAGNVVQITPQVGGTVTSIGADDTDYVKPGQVLVQLDAADALVALSQAESQLAQTVRQVRTLYANNAPLVAQVAQREADLARLQAESLARTAGNAAVAAEAAVRAAKAQLTAAEAQTKGSSAEDYPSVIAASAKVREAYLALQRTRLVSPVEGYVAKRGVQLGQRVAPGASLMTVVGLHNLWVDANFKESQLAQLRIGQKTELMADVYGDKITYHGTVVGMGAGTGAAFSLLPAQNATGNWIKVVQRVPVRIALSPEDLAQHPLRVGLSMEVKVDVRDQQGEVLTTATRNAPVAQTSIYDMALPQAEERIAHIVAGQNVAPLKELPGLPAIAMADAQGKAPAAVASGPVDSHAPQAK